MVHIHICPLQLTPCSFVWGCREHLLEVFFGLVGNLREALGNPPGACPVFLPCVFGRTTEGFLLICLCPSLQMPPATSSTCPLIGSDPLLLLISPSRFFPMFAFPCVLVHNLFSMTSPAHDAHSDIYSFVSNRSSVGSLSYMIFLPGSAV